MSFSRVVPAAVGFGAAMLLMGGAYAADEPIVFKSDVALVRVDAQVLDSSKRAITGLNAHDFRLFDEGKELPIRNFGREELPIDVLFLIDVSGSMEPHVQRLAATCRRFVTPSVGVACVLSASSFAEHRN